MSYSDPKLWFSWDGRVNRRPYFFAGLAAAVFVRGAELVPQDYVLAYLPVVLIASYVAIVLGIKRAHDRGRTGWFTLLFFVPILNLWPAIELTFFKGDAGPNTYGPDPLAPEAAPAAPPAA